MHSGVGVVGSRLRDFFCVVFGPSIAQRSVLLGFGDEFGLQRDSLNVGVEFSFGVVPVELCRGSSCVGGVLCYFEDVCVL